jgi:hypothetical protein
MNELKGDSVLLISAPTATSAKDRSAHLTADKVTRLRAQPPMRTVLEQNPIILYRPDNRRARSRCAPARCAGA